MEIPFDIECNLKRIGNIQVCLKNTNKDANGIPLYQSDTNSIFLSNRQVAEKLIQTTEVELYKHQNSRASLLVSPR